MTTGAAPAGRLNPERRAASFYFTFYMTAGAATAYAGIWFADVGLSSGEIGIVNALPVLLMLVANLVVGRLADRAEDWRSAIVIGAMVSGVVAFGLLPAAGFWGILLVWTAAYLPVAAVGPVLDAAALRMTRRNGTDYGALRAWGTVGYMLVIPLTGYVVVWLGPQAFVPLFIALGLLRAAAALFLPRFRLPRDQRPADLAGGARHLIEVMKPWFLLPLVGWSMVYATHLVLNGFQALLWKQQGLPEDVIGLLIALGALSEATMMFVFARFAGRFTARHLILVSAIVAVLRWIAMGFAPPLPVLVGLQALHGISFALGFMGCVHFIANWTSEDIAAEAQGFFNTLQQGMSVLALLAFGGLAGILGPAAYFATAAFAALGGVLIFASLRLQQAKPR